MGSALCCQEDNVLHPAHSMHIKAGEASMHQGTYELKQNYKLDASTKVIGSGQFGKVYATHNLFEKNLKVAIKVMDKEKLDEYLD